jgi:hypothetical protein
VTALAIFVASGRARAEPASPPVLPASPSPGDLATARAALREGQALRETGDLEGSFARLLTAWELVQTPVTGFELGKAHMLKGRILQAHEMFKKVVRMPALLEESDRSATARSEASRLAADLEPRIPSLRLRLVLPPGATAKVHVDDEEVSVVDTTPRRVDPGPHVVVAKAGDGPELRASVAVQEGETKDVELAPTWVLPRPPPAPGPPQAIVVKTTNKLVFAGFGGASASLVFAGVSTLLAVSNANRAEERCGKSYCPPDVLQNDANVARFWGVMAVASTVSTAVFLSVGIVASSFPSQQRAFGVAFAPALGPGGAGMTGSF